MAQHQTIGYHAGTSFLHRLTGTTKLVAFILLSIACMTTYDTRFLVAISIGAIVLLKIAHVRWHQVSFVVKFILIFSVLNIVAVYALQPEYGVQLYGSRHLIWQGLGYWTVTQEELFYLFNLILKYICTIPLSLLFLFTTQPSEFASSLNRIGVSYRISYAVALTLRYIPDVQEDYFSIAQAQQARGLEMSKKGKLLTRLKGGAGIIFPLIFSSLERIETISIAMELRRFGHLKKRTWYQERKAQRMDYFVLGIVLCICLAVIALFVVNHGRFYNPFRR